MMRRRTKARRRSDYACVGRPFDSQRAADEYGDAAPRHLLARSPMPYVCVEGHWHVEIAYAQARKASI